MKFTTDMPIIYVQAEPIFKDPHRYPELADPLLEGNFPPRALNQAVAVAAMCVNEEASARPLMSDVVSALSFLGTDTDPPGIASIDNITPQQQVQGNTEYLNLLDDDTAFEHQQAAAAAAAAAAEANN